MLPANVLDQVVREQLHAAGYTTLTEIAVAPPDEVATVLDVDRATAENLIVQAESELDEPSNGATP